MTSALQSVRVGVPRNACHLLMRENATRYDIRCDDNQRDCLPSTNCFSFCADALRFDALGVDYLTALESSFGRTFSSLDEAKATLLAGVAEWDKNGNGYVCAFELRGTRAYLGETAKYFFGIDDDKFASN